MPSQRTRSMVTGPDSAPSHLDDDAFRDSLAPYHDEHVRDRYWHAGCPQCAAEEAAQAELRAAKAAARRTRRRA